MVVKRLIEEAFEEGVVEEGSVLGVTGRAGITGKKPELILEYSKKYFEDVIFISDALAMGSAMMIPVRGRTSTCSAQLCTIVKVILAPFLR